MATHPTIAYALLGPLWLSCPQQFSHTQPRVPTSLASLPSMPGPLALSQTWETWSYEEAALSAGCKAWTIRKLHYQPASAGCCSWSWRMHFSEEVPRKPGHLDNSTMARPYGHYGQLRAQGYQTAFWLSISEAPSRLLFD